MAQVKRQQEAEKGWDGERGISLATGVDNRKGWEEHGEAMRRLGKTLPEAVVESIAGALGNRR